MSGIFSFFVGLGYGMDEGSRSFEGIMLIMLVE